MYFQISFFLFLLLWTYLYIKLKLSDRKIQLKELDITRTILAQNLYEKHELQSDYPEIFKTIEVLAKNVSMPSKEFLRKINIISFNSNLNKHTVEVHKLSHEAMKRELILLQKKDQKLFNEYFDFYMSVFKIKAPIRFFLERVKIAFRIIILIVKTFVKVSKNKSSKKTKYSQENIKIFFDKQFKEKQRKEVVNNERVDIILANN